MLLVDHADDVVWPKVGVHRPTKVFRCWLTESILPAVIQIQLVTYSIALENIPVKPEKKVRFRSAVCCVV